MKSRCAMSLLSRDLEKDALVAYLEESHAMLATLLPSDTTAADLFRKVERNLEKGSGDLAEYFDASPALPDALKRALDRLSGDIEDQRSAQG